MEILPEIPFTEQNYIQPIVEPFDDETARQFALSYRTARKDETTILLLTLVGFLGVNGLHRFVLDDAGMGILYLLTAGLCWIGTIVDAVNYKYMTERYNVNKARIIASAFGYKNK
jgi:TM2 domain-containing membrane protein YozV